MLTSQTDHPPLNWRYFWQVTLPYWRSQERWGAIGLLLIVLGLSLVSSLLLVLVSILLGEVTSALAAREGERFSQAILWFGGMIVVGVPLLACKTYVQGKLSLYWRRWLTDRYLRHYLSDRQFYQITTDAAIDNPDQRIAEDIKILTQQSLFFVVIFFDSGLQLLAFTGVLWSISQPLMVFLILYALVGTIVTHFVFGRALISINSEQLKREADFRFSLVRVRENAEAIAFYQGEAQESAQVWQRFLLAWQNFDRLIRWQLGLNFFQNGYQYLTFLLPALVLAPAILAGQREVGVEAQASTAFRIILLALALVIQQFEQLTALIASIDRLSALDRELTDRSPGLDRTVVANTCSLDSSLESAALPQIEVIPSAHLAVHHLMLYTPDYQKKLIADLSFQLLPGQSLLLMGPSGVGKSSLLRSIAGLWRSGSGKIERPLLHQMFFLPQRPYMRLGTLREQLCYPDITSSSQYPVDRLEQVLQQVNLVELLERVDLETTADWSQMLSIGEQQRLAFARLLLAQPQYALLDEATSALDLENEGLLYQQLQAHQIAYLSVGHRSTLKDYHQAVLELQEPGN